MPLSYQGFGPAAILVMLACLVLAELYKKFKQRKHEPHH